MKGICILIRIGGSLLGLFVLVSGVADVLGFVPYSDATPPWTARLISALPAILGGVILLAPIKYFLREKPYAVLATAYAILVLAVAVQGGQGVLGYLEGIKHWAILPTSLAFLAIPAANAFVLWYSHQRSVRPPNNSFKGKPLRGSPYFRR